MKKRSFKDYASISLKGMAVGAVEFLPGISGGTIAFVIGIYQELLNTIKGALPAFKQLFGKKPFKQRIADFWIALNGNFIVAFALGMIVAIGITIVLVKHMLVQYPFIFYTFVFGLILASVVLVYKKVSKWTWICYLLCLVGVGIACLLPVDIIQQKAQVGATAQFIPVPLWYFFVCSILASWAFILPGTSGTFVMLLMGAYKTQVLAFHSFDLVYVATFVVGCLTGLIIFSNFLSWLLKKYHDFTVALLMGFIIGSLRVIWPWKNTVTEEIFVFDSFGVPWPQMVTTTLGNARPDTMLTQAIIACSIGIVLVLGIEFVAKSFSKKTI
jgi:putative membrane protein